MKVTLTGSSGLLGSHLVRAMNARGWETNALSRADLAMAPHDLAHRIEGSDLVINLAGAPIIGRWTSAYKEEMYNSRILTTQRLVLAMQCCTTPPPFLVSASAVGIYPSHGGPYAEKDKVIDDTYLGRLAADWEKEALKYTLNGRVAVLRFGIVLAREGGALKKLLPVFRFGLGGPIGKGNQAFAWIHIGDIVNVLFFLLSNPGLNGVFNWVAPTLVTNKQFTKELAKSLHRPAFFPVPGFGLKALFGEGADVLTQGQSVQPSRLLESGFQFKFPDLKPAIDDILFSSDIG